MRLKSDDRISDGLVGLKSFQPPAVSLPPFPRYSFDLINMDAISAAAALPGIADPVAIASLTAVTNNFITGAMNSLFMILVTEIGDKTFFIAAILAMRHGRLVVYAGAMG